MHKVRHTMIVLGLLVWLFSISNVRTGCAFNLEDVAAIGAAYMTHLSLHELGHQVVAEEVAADSPRMHFFTNKNGKFYPGLSTYQNIPKESKLPYAVGGDRMAGYTFEFALQSYRMQPTTYNKALLFFTCTDFFAYTLLANYVYPENDMYDPNLIREEAGLSKGALLSLVTAKSVMNTYRVMNPDATFFPMIWVDKKSAAFLIGFNF
jgi:hypothetical protein